ncbi:MAG: hypothetical protein U9N07_08770 [Euryarchaeota archaeon]|nr:hypothetical protein [Euryarchaeota archaeon]
MIKNGTISIMLTSIVAIVCLFAVAAPVSADMDVTIDPCRSPPGASPGYTCVLNYSDTCDIYFVNVTIPKGYTANDTVGCNCSEIILTLRNDSTGEIISKSIAFKNETGYWVNVTHPSSCDGVYGPFIANCSEGAVTEICMASTTSLHLTMPTTSINGSINISLGALGPVASEDSVALQFASDCIRNPATSGRYIWSVTAGPCGYSDSGVVCIMHPGDINGDDWVWLLDLMELADAFDSHPGDPDWNQCADLDCDGHIYLLDLMILGDNFGNDYRGIP